MTKDYGGVINELVSGEWQEPGTGKRYQIPPENIVIKETLEGAEAELIRQQHPEGSLMIVTDPNTRDVLGKRILDALKADGRDVSEFVWDVPKCTKEGVDEVAKATSHADSLIAVGSGTINDSVKYATFLDNRQYSVFATSPMNAFTTNTASVSFDGHKKSITCHGAKGIFFDLSVISNCPPRLKAAAYADVICRTTAQVDWLMSHLLFNTAYSDTPYTLLAYDEADMIDSATAIGAGDLEAIGMLTRISAIMGLGTCFTETTHSGSMAEHMISHYIDMFAGDIHPGSSHGEQVGVGTITMSRLQNLILGNAKPPLLHASDIPGDELKDKFGEDMGNIMIEQTTNKALDEREADRINQYFADNWQEFSSQLKSVMLPYDRLYNSMKAAGCQTSAKELKLDEAFYRDAVYYARHIRDRFSMLDIAADSDQLRSFVDNHTDSADLRVL